eukprot:592193-Rhodomonas_salina.2
MRRLYSLVFARRFASSNSFPTWSPNSCLAPAAVHALQYCASTRYARNCASGGIRYARTVLAARYGQCSTGGGVRYGAVLGTVLSGTRRRLAD